MKIVKIFLGIVVAILALAGVAATISRIKNYDGSAFESGGLGASIAIPLLATVGSIMLFKSAFKKTEESKVNDDSEK